MKGYKTLLVFAAISLAGWAIQFIDSLKETLASCTTTVTSTAVEAGTEVIKQSQLCELGIPAWVIGVLGMVGMALRFVTSTPVGKK